MAVEVSKSNAPYIGPAADRAAYVGNAAVGDFYFEDDTGLMYRKSVAGAWVVVAPGAATITSIVPGTGATNLGKAEDSAHTSGDVGVMALGVQKATPADVSTEGDYTPLQVSGGKLWTREDSRAYDVATTITRPANMTAYAANDVLGGALDLGVLGPSAKSVLITGVQLEADIAAIPAGMTTFNLYLFSVTPPSAVADNGAFDIPAGDRASFLGKIALGAPVDEGSTLYCEANGINKQVKLAGTNLFAYLVTVGGFTPAANSEVYKLTLHTVEV